MEFYGNRKHWGNLSEREKELRHHIEHIKKEEGISNTDISIMVNKSTVYVHQFMQGVPRANNKKLEDLIIDTLNPIYGTKHGYLMRTTGA